MTDQRDLLAIKKLGEEFFAAVNARDLERRMATMDSAVIIMPPDRPPIVGKEEVLRLSRDYVANFEETCSLAYKEVEVAGTWGFARAVVTATCRSKANGRIEELSMTNLWILRRQPDGEWRFWRIMFNRDTPSSLPDDAPAAE
jgi:ketosteroid isomerase-like protein